MSLKCHSHVFVLKKTYYTPIVHCPPIKYIAFPCGRIGKQAQLGQKVQLVLFHVFEKKRVKGRAASLIIHCPYLKKIFMYENGSGTMINFSFSPISARFNYWIPSA